MARPTSSGQNSRIQWTDDKHLHLIETVVMVKKKLIVEKANEPSKLWQKVAAQLSRDVFGNIGLDRLRKIAQIQFHTLMSTYNGTNRRKYKNKKKLSDNVFAKLEEYDCLFPTLPCERADDNDEQYGDALEEFEEKDLLAVDASTPCSQELHVNEQLFPPLGPYRICYPEGLRFSNKPTEQVSKTHPKRSLKFSNKKSEQVSKTHPKRNSSSSNKPSAQVSKTQLDDHVDPTQHQSCQWTESMRLKLIDIVMEVKAEQPGRTAKTWKQVIARLAQLPAGDGFQMMLGHQRGLMPERGPVKLSHHPVARKFHLLCRAYKAAMMWTGSIKSYISSSRLLTPAVFKKLGEHQDLLERDRTTAGISPPIHRSCRQIAQSGKSNFGIFKNKRMTRASSLTVDLKHEIHSRTAHAAPAKTSSRSSYMQESVRTEYDNEVEEKSDPVAVEQFKESTDETISDSLEEKSHHDEKSIQRKRSWRPGMFPMAKDSKFTATHSVEELPLSHYMSMRRMHLFFKKCNWTRCRQITSEKERKNGRNITPLDSLGNLADYVDEAPDLRKNTSKTTRPDEFESDDFQTDAEEDNKSLRDKVYSLANTPDDPRPGCFDGYLRTSSTHLNSSEIAVDRNSSSPGQRGYSGPTTKRNTRLATRGLDRNLLKSLLDKEFSQLIWWCEHQLVPAGSKFVNNVAKASPWLHGINRRKRSKTPKYHPYNDLVRDTFLKRFKSKVQFRVSDFKLDVTGLLCRTTQEIFGDLASCNHSSST